MNSVDFVTKNLNILHEKFLQSNIRYEYIKNLRSHLIEITPKEFYECNDYINEELLFEKDFGEKFSEEDIIFISDDSLNKIKNPIFEVYAQQKGIFRIDFQELDMTHSFDEPLFYTVSNLTYAGENEYALAA